MIIVRTTPKQHTMVYQSSDRNYDLVSDVMPAIGIVVPRLSIFGHGRQCGIGSGRELFSNRTLIVYLHVPSKFLKVHEGTPLEETEASTVSSSTVLVMVFRCDMNCAC